LELDLEGAFTVVRIDPFSGEVEATWQDPGPIVLPIDSLREDALFALRPITPRPGAV
jgi:hypothetical protein